MSQDQSTQPRALTPEQRRDAFTCRNAKEGETEFAAIVRNRSGIDAGEIDFCLKHGFVLEELDNRDKQALVDTAAALLASCEDATGKRSVLRPTFTRSQLSDLLDTAKTMQRAAADNGGGLRAFDEAITRAEALVGDHSAGRQTGPKRFTTGDVEVAGALRGVLLSYVDAGHVTDINGDVFVNRVGQKVFGEGVWREMLRVIDAKASR